MERRLTALFFLGALGSSQAIKYTFQIHCHIDLTFYPLDTQHCPFNIRSLANVGDHLDLRWIHESNDTRHSGLKSIRVHGITDDLSFSLEKPVAWRAKRYFVRGVYVVLLANFTFRRELTSKVVKTYLPSSLVVMMSWAGFWIDVTAVPARVSLAVTSVLTIVTLIRQSFDVSYLNALDVWLFICEFMVIAVVLEFVVAYTVAKTGHGVFDSIGILQSPYQSEIVARDEEEHSHFLVKNSTFKELVDEMMMRSLKPQSKNTVDHVSRIVFPSVFFAFVALYWIVLMAFTLGKTELT